MVLCVTQIICIFLYSNFETNSPISLITSFLLKKPFLPSKNIVEAGIMLKSEHEKASHLDILISSSLIFSSKSSDESAFFM